MDFDGNSSRTLFLKYALPCGGTLVKRGVISSKFLNDTIKVVADDGEASGHPEKIFKTALGMCIKIAKKSGKKSIGENDIRRYFLFEHDDAVDRRYQIFGDFNTLRCRTYPGKVSRSGYVWVSVKTPIGVSKYRSDFRRFLKKGDLVVVHRSFIVEKIGKHLFQSLWKSKESYFKRNQRL
jgi:hypothetical protein